nr:uncharacterized protein LOC107454745 [Parasteatoda tepidariorum]
MAQMLPYILPLLLGRTINLDTMEVGVDIFSKNVILNPEIIQSPLTETKYKIVDNAVESRNLLDVEGSFSLNVKAGVFKAGASGAYLSDVYNRENTVEVAIKASYQQVTEQIPADAKPIETWRQLGDALGTHFVRSITYGGELIAAIRMECNSTRDKQRIAASLEVGGKIEVFDLGVEAEAEYMKDLSKTVQSTQIKIFSSIPLNKAPNDMDTLKLVLSQFPEDLKSFNGGKGIPIKMELWPLNVLDATLPEKLKNRALEASLEDFERKFDDLLNTKAAIGNWMKVLNQHLTSDQEKKIGEFYTDINKKIRPFYEVIGDLDLSKGSEQLKKAEDSYGNSVPGIYYKKYLFLRETVAQDQGEWSLSRGNGATYIHWGKSNCSEATETMSNGTIVGPEGQGGGANFLCLPQNEYVKVEVKDQKNIAVLQGNYYI